MEAQSSQDLACCLCETANARSKYSSAFAVSASRVPGSFLSGSTFQAVRAPRRSASQHTLYFFSKISFAAMIASLASAGDESESLNPFKLVEAGD
jgi:hypothetical protein